jgi:beta-galactosidase
MAPTPGRAGNVEDLRKLGADLKAASPFLMDNPVAPAQVAILYSHEADRGFRIEQYINGIRYYEAWTYRFFHALSDVYLHRDVIGTGNADLSGYKIIFAPLLPYVPERLRAALKGWVEAGGTLVFGPVSGYRTKEWTFFTEHGYGDINQWSGIEVESRIPIGLERRTAETPLFVDWDPCLGMAAGFEASLWSDALSTTSGKVLARYRNGMHHGLPAIIRNTVGKGSVVVLGTDPGRENLSRLFLQLADESGILPVATGDAGVVIGPRVRGEQLSGYVLSNISGSRRQLQIRNGLYQDILNNETIDQDVTLEPYQVLVLKCRDGE